MTAGVSQPPKLFFTCCLLNMCLFLPSLGLQKWLLTTSSCDKYALDNAVKTVAPHRHQQSRRHTNIGCCVAAAKSPINAEWFKKCEGIEAKVRGGWDKQTESRWMEVKKRLTDTCEAKWESVLEHSLGCFYYQGHIRDKFMNRTGGFPYVPNVTNKARVLMLGDSVSRGTWVEAMNMASSSQKFMIYGAPTNCGGLSSYSANLDMWLGTCQWDLIQFNIGLHFFSKNLTEYSEGLIQVVTRLNRHSPRAKIVFAQTTPSPFDSEKTTPNETACKNFHKFFKAGRVYALNKAAKDALEPLGVTLSNRYDAIQPVLGQHQNPCDVHFKRSGYELLARTDLEVVARILPTSVL
mmetsp:Transcript_8989/g.30335  ORF Transcript_8989/g.30335 Transcript_8989/m.30335 type:complete len:350 (-) Transcript_8989:1886-2935(-)|eukprot:CAMPEP_0179719924 /NCGR_PEP_ID=MMETSP0938-20121108/3680_1 /TAXON_ID=548131 ORGANISM="Ostreococcus mediterraneus, Strain clade-D-RCC1107" /NCGR_SAMPLE_ID=MMETSP0938 /ASSEMBLY_ACC=CAM_ASM_000576 /LENGTH=349 /DNA_ID=CAMNT_0021593783 /DNA_START=2060 /DNA_END=3109 /DNA_ORIENTATION=+